LLEPTGIPLLLVWMACALNLISRSNYGGWLFNFRLLNLNIPTLLSTVPHISLYSGSSLLFILLL